MTDKITKYEAAVLLNTDFSTIRDLVHTHELTPFDEDGKLVRSEIEFFAKKAS